MLYIKNLPLWERLLRACLGLLVMAAAFYLPLAPLLQWALAASGLMFAATGVAGFCPMCALAGRTLSK